MENSQLQILIGTLWALAGMMINDGFMVVIGVLLIFVSLFMSFLEHKQWQLNRQRKGLELERVRINSKQFSLMTEQLNAIINMMKPSKIKQKGGKK